jgi:hypothetical protein
MTVLLAILTPLTEINRADALVGRNFFRRAFGQHFAGDEHDDAAGEAKHQVHVVLDDEHGNVGIEL